MTVLLRHKINDVVCGYDMFNRRKEGAIEDVEFVLQNGLDLPYQEFYNKRNNSMLYSNYKNYEDIIVEGNTVSSYSASRCYKSYRDKLLADTGEDIQYSRQKVEIDNEYEFGQTVYYYGRGSRLREGTVENLEVRMTKDSTYILYGIKSHNKEPEKSYQSVNHTCYSDSHFEYVSEGDIFVSKEAYIDSQLEHTS